MLESMSKPTRQTYYSNHELDVEKCLIIDIINEQCDELILASVIQANSYKSVLIKDATLPTNVRH